MMFIYNYEPLTGAYTGRSDADPDPMTPDGYLIPAHATTIAPPVVASGEVAVFSNGAWTVVQDNRGTWYTADGSALNVAALGDAAPANAVRTAPPTVLHVLQAGAWVLDIARVAAAKTAEIEADYKTAINVIASQYPDTERDSWPKQESEARAWVANNATPTPLLTAIATRRGITVADLAARVIANADTYAIMGGDIIGRRQARMDAIAAAVAANDLAALQAVVW